MGFKENDAAVRRRLGEGDLAGALESAKALTRSDPASVKPRILLFQLFAINGDWQRAATQLDTAGGLSSEVSSLVGAYRDMIRAELFRERVFAGRETPVIFGPPERWVASLLEALRLDGLGETTKAADLRAEALEAAPASPGALDGGRFEWIADGDQRLGPIVEASFGGRHHWVPLIRLRAIEIEAPTDLRDLVWAPAKLTFVNGGDTVALLPVRYPGTTAAADPALRLSRRTEWVERPGGSLIGLGQRMLITDTGETALLDARRVDLDPVASTETGGGDG